MIYQTAAVAGSTQLRLEWIETFRLVVCNRFPREQPSFGLIVPL